MKVCFFSPTAYSYFNPDSNTWAGGAETQQVLIARHMITKGIDVSFIVGDYGQADVEEVGGISLIKSFSPFTGNRKLRFLPDMKTIWLAMKKADADVYNQRSTAFYTGQLAYFSRRLGRRFTFSVGSDYNCYTDCKKRLPFPMTRLYRYGLQRADAVIAQTEKQQSLLRSNFGIEAVLIRNGVPIPAEEESTAGESTQTLEKPQPVPERDTPLDFLWVGNIRRLKRPELYLELARRFPTATFTMIGGRGKDIPYYERITGAIREIPNITYIGFVPPDDIETYYRRAYAYINTSDLEGFPNTYLHSWVWGVPTLTIEIDPDGIIARHRLGAVTGSFEGLIETVQALCDDPSLRSDMSRRARRYVREHHDITRRGDDYIRLFEKLLAISKRSASRRSG